MPSTGLSAFPLALSLLLALFLSYCSMTFTARLSAFTVRGRYVVTRSEFDSGSSNLSDFDSDWDSESGFDLVGFDSVAGCSFKIR